ncbi:uncharacterized protein LOC136028614 isoform X2 [Artemia franciscana]|uniref:uncharacterized protein LOC136028614 isoform X2 n=1 Tax=Artemia franciscana TaxID=6661 RepID=UPI0032D9C474
MKRKISSFILCLLCATETICPGEITNDQIYSIPHQAWWARDIPSSYISFFQRAKTREDGSHLTAENIWPFGVLTHEGYKARYFFGDATDRTAGFPPIRPSSIKFLLYTSKTQLNPERFTLYTVTRLVTSNFNRRRPTKIIIPGLNSNPAFVVYIEMKKAYVQHEDVNVIIVNWVADAMSPSYIRTMQRMWTMAKIVARFIERMPPTPEIHILSTSLACHGAGFVGKLSRRTINRITGFCSHWKSIKYFTDTIRGEQYVAYPCSNNQAIHHLHTMIPFGEHVPHSATGDFCLAVDRSEDRSPQKTAFQKLAESLPNIDLRSVIF